MASNGVLAIDREASDVQRSSDSSEDGSEVPMDFGVRPQPSPLGVIDALPCKTDVLPGDLLSWGELTPDVLRQWGLDDSVESDRRAKRLISLVRNSLTQHILHLCLRRYARAPQPYQLKLATSRALDQYWDEVTTRGMLLCGAYVI